MQRIGIKTGESYEDRVLDASLEWLDEHWNDTGWMLYIGFLDPHFPFYAEQRYWDYYDALITEIPKELSPPYTSLNEPLNWLRAYFKCEQLDEETIRRVLVGYHSAIAQLDERLGILLDHIDKLGLRDNTLFIYTSDHGEQLGYHGMWWKCCMFEQSSRIPLIIRVPGAASKQVEHPVNLTDLFPTVCDFMDVPMPEHINGESMRQLILNGIDSGRKDFTFSEYHAHGMPCGMFMIRWRQYKYVYYCNYGAQLFDLEADSGENYCLIKHLPEDLTTKEAADICHKKLLSVCDPYEVDRRAKGFQARMKKALGITEYDAEKGEWVPHPEHDLSADFSW